MTYLEQLQTAQDNNIAALDLYIAQVVAWNFFEFHPRFEDLCSAVRAIWLKTNNISLEDIAYALKERLADDSVTLDAVMRKDTEDFKKVCDFAYELSLN